MKKFLDVIFILFLALLWGDLLVCGCFFDDLTWEFRVKLCHAIAKLQNSLKSLNQFYMKILHLNEVHVPSPRNRSKYIEFQNKGQFKNFVKENFRFSTPTSPCNGICTVFMVKRWQNHCPHSSITSFSNDP